MELEKAGDADGVGLPSWERVSAYLSRRKGHRLRSPDISKFYTQKTALEDS
jgi:hypothetical protein